MPNSQSATAAPISSAQIAQAVAHCGKGIGLFYKKNYKEAFKEIDAAIRINPNYADAYSLRGSCYRDTGKLQEALVAFDYSISLLRSDNPKFGWFYYNRAVAYNMLKDYQKALNDANKFVEFAPGNGMGIAFRDEIKIKLQATVAVPAKAVVAPTVAAPAKPVVAPTVAVPAKVVVDPTVAAPAKAVVAHTVAAPAKPVVAPTVAVPAKAVVAATVAAPAKSDPIPLHTAAANGNITLLESLVSQGADLRAKCKDGLNALDYAVKNGHTAAKQWLESIAEFDLGNGQTIAVVPTHTQPTAKANEFLITYRSPKAPSVSYRAREVKAIDTVFTHHHETKPRGVTVTMTSDTLQKELKNFAHLPEAQRTKAALASITLKEVNELHTATHKNPQQITNFDATLQSTSVLKDNILKSHVVVQDETGVFLVNIYKTNNHAGPWDNML